MHAHPSLSLSLSIISFIPYFSAYQEMTLDGSWYVWLTALVVSWHLVHRTTAQEFLGEPFTVLRRKAGGKDIEYVNRMLVRCSGGGSDTFTKLLNETSGEDRNATFHCGVPQITYQRSLLGWVPNDTQLLISEICTSQGFPNTSNAIDLHNNFISASRRAFPAISYSRRSGFDLLDRSTHRNHTSKLVQMRRSKGGIAGTGIYVGDFLIGPLGGGIVALLFGGSSNKELDSLKGEVANLQSTMADAVNKLKLLTNKTDTLADLQLEESELNNDRFEQFTAAERNKRAEFERIQQQIDLSGQITDSLKKSTEAGFVVVNQNIHDMGERQAHMDAQLVLYANESLQKFREVYFELGNLTLNTAAALASMAARMQDNENSRDGKQFRLTATVSDIATTIRDAASERQFRNIAAHTFQIMLDAAAEKGFRAMSDIAAAPPNSTAAEQQIVLEAFTAGFVVNIPNTDGSSRQEARTYTVRLMSRHSFLSEVVGAVDTWSSVLQNLGAGCWENCTHVSEGTDLFAQCRGICSLWMEVSNASCTHTPSIAGDTDWWKKNQSWMTPFHPLTKSSLSSEYCHHSIKATDVRLVTSLAHWEALRLPLCYGPGDSSDPTFVQTLIGRSQYTLESATPEQCDQGMIAVVDLSLITMDYLLSVMLGRMMTALQTMLPSFDRELYGVLPSGVTSIREDLATLGDGSIGRCMWNSLSVVSTDDWVPVFAYKKVATRATIEVTVGGSLPTGVHAPTTISNTLTEAADVSFGNAALYPDTFIGVGLVQSQLNNGHPILDVRQTELPTGSARTREGTPLYLYSPSREGISVEEWENINKEKFNHNAAAVSVQRDLVPIYSKTDADDRLYCVPGWDGEDGPGHGRPPNTGSSLCAQLEDAGWHEDSSAGPREYENPYSTTTIVTMRPQSASYIIPVEVPAGRFVTMYSTECPQTYASAVYGGLVLVTATNRNQAQLRVQLRVVAGCGGQSPTDWVLTLGAFESSGQRFALCAQQVQVSREVAPETYEVCHNVSLVSASSVAQQSLGTFSGEPDAGYVKAAVMTVADDITLRATAVSTTLAGLMRETIQEFSAVLVNTTGVRLPQANLDKLTGIVANLTSLAQTSFNASQDLHTQTNFSLGDTAAWQEEVRRLALESKQFLNDTDKLIRAMEELNARGGHLADIKKNLTAELKIAQQEFLDSFNKTTQLIGSTFNKVAEAIEADNSLNTDRISSLFVSLMKGPKAVAGFFRDEIGGAFKKLVDMPGQALDAIGAMFSTIGLVIMGLFVTGVVVAIAVLMYKVCSRGKEDHGNSSASGSSRHLNSTTNTRGPSMYPRYTSVNTRGH